MTDLKKPDAVYDAVLKRYVASCPYCPYFAVRSKREAAIHVVSQHVAYGHDDLIATGSVFV